MVDYLEAFTASLVLGGKVLGVLLVVQILRGLCWLVNMFFIQPPSDPLRHLPGPDAPKMQNHFREVMDPAKSPETHEEWSKLYGKTFRFHGFGAFDYRLMSLDFRVISHVLNSPIYEKPWQTRRLLTRLLGRGVFAMEGDEHRIQRKIIGPAFTTQVIKSLSPIMFQKAEELKEKWDAIITSNHQQVLPCIPTAPEKHFYPNDEKSLLDEAVIDAAHWVSRATLDVIGLAGFDYAFSALEHEDEEVYAAYRNMFRAADCAPGFKRIVELFFPIVEKLLPDEGIRKVNASLRTIKRRGEELVRSKKQAIMAEIRDAKDIREKDILSLLIKANLSENPAQRLSDSDLVDQLSTFLFAGSDSTAISISWCLHYLSLHPGLQCRVRDELTTCSSPAEGAMDATSALDALPLLDAVVKETLRLAPPVHGTIRVATRDDFIPLSEPIVLRTNELVREVRIRKGSYVHIPIEGLNFSKDIWGDDALQFNPDRWATHAPSIPGLSNVMSFSFGPHSCIGWRFSVLEMKVFLSVLLPHFSFSPAADISRYNAIITRPYVKDKFELGSALPLCVTRYNV